jgi:hypothetical protein
MGLKKFDTYSQGWEWTAVEPLTAKVKRECLEVMDPEHRNFYLWTLSKAQLYQIIMDLRRQGVRIPGPVSRMNRDRLRRILVEIQLSTALPNNLSG